MAVSRRARNTFRFLQDVEGMTRNELKELSAHYRRTGNWTEWHRVEGATDRMSDALGRLRGNRNFVDPSRARTEQLQDQQRTAQEILDVVHELAEQSPDRRMRAMFSHFDAEMNPVGIGQNQAPALAAAGSAPMAPGRGNGGRGGAALAGMSPDEAPVYSFGLMLREFAEKLPERTAGLDRHYSGVHSSIEDMADRIMHQAMLVNPSAGQSRFAAGSNRDAMERDLEEQLARDIPGGGGRSQPRRDVLAQYALQDGPEADSTPASASPPALSASGNRRPQIGAAPQPQPGQRFAVSAMGGVRPMRNLSPTVGTPGSEFGAFMQKLMGGLGVLGAPSLASREAEARRRIGAPAPRTAPDPRSQIWGRRRRPGMTSSI